MHPYHEGLASDGSIPRECARLYSRAPPLTSATATAAARTATADPSAG